MSHFKRAKRTRPGKVSNPIMLRTGREFYNFDLEKVVQCWKQNFRHIRGFTPAEWAEMCVKARRELFSTDVMTCVIKKRSK